MFPRTFGLLDSENRTLPKNTAAVEALCQRHPGKVDVLLAPAPFDALYPHYLCAMTDAALGETDRYAGEQAQYNGILAELAAWLRRTYPPRACTRWQW